MKLLALGIAVLAALALESLSSLSSLTFNPWQVLEVPSTATRAEIRKRYRHLARTEHPDTARDEVERQRKSRRFAEIVEAYGQLMNSEKEVWNEEWKAWDEWDEVEVAEETWVPLVALGLWFGLLAVLFTKEDSFTWEECFREWQWWCSLKGN